MLAHHWVLAICQTPAHRCPIRLTAASALNSVCSTTSGFRVQRCLGPTCAGRATAPACSHATHWYLRTNAHRAVVVAKALLDTEHTHSDSWSLNARAAMLGCTWAEFQAFLGEVPDLAMCDPACLFALKQSAESLGLPMPQMVQLVKQVPGILNTPCSAVQQNIQVLQSALLVPSAAAVHILVCDPPLISMKCRAVNSLVERISNALGCSDQPAQRQHLGEVLAALVPMVLLSQPQQLIQQVQRQAKVLGVTSADAVAVLQAESQVFGDLQQLLAATDQREAEWKALSNRIGLSQQELTTYLVQHLLGPEPRYSLRSPAQLEADLTQLSNTSYLSKSVVLPMLLSAPSVLSVPGSFWDLLLQYLLFLAPHWRKEIDAMPAGDAAALILGLFNSSDMLKLEREDFTCVTADVDYSRELKVLGALLDSGISAPVLDAVDRLQAGKVWRLIYLCNPRLTAAQQLAAAQANAEAETSNSTGSRSPWSWVPLKLLPPALMQQRQRSSMLSCQIDNKSAQPQAARVDMLAASAEGNNSGAEIIEGLRDAVAEDTQTFCARHPGYVHWLFASAFELEWSNHAAAAPSTTWDA